MAWFNPQPVTFNPSSAIMEGANAVGKTMQELYKQNYQEAQDKIKEQQAQKAFDLQSNQFDFHKDRAVTQDAQWDKNYQAGRDDAGFNQGMQVANYNQNATNHADTVNYQNKSLGLQQQTLNNTTNALNDKKQQEVAKGLYIAEIFPELADKFGVRKPKVNIDGIDEAQPSSSYNYDNSKLQAFGGLDDLTKTKMALDAKETDPTKLFYAQIAQEKADETKRMHQENESLKKISALKTQFNTNPKSVLGIDPASLPDADYSAFIADLNSGNIGTVTQEKGKFYGTTPRYVPFSQQTSIQQQGVPNNDPLGIRKSK